MREVNNPRGSEGVGAEESKIVRGRNRMIGRIAPECEDGSEIRREGKNRRKKEIRVDHRGGAGDKLCCLFTLIMGQREGYDEPEPTGHPDSTRIGIAPGGAG